MRKSKYSYFFEMDDEYVGYSFLSNNFTAFPIKFKKQVDRILKYPDEILTHTDVEIYSKLCENRHLIPDDFNEYDFLLNLHYRYIHRTDYLGFTIIPTLACSCRCTYCYELHPSLTKSKMSREAINNLKNYISKKAKNLKKLVISWFGGEPLLCIDIIKEISEFCLDLCLSNLVTNGVLLNKKMLKL